MSRLRSVLPFAALGLALLLGGCVVYPAYPGYAPYYGGAYYYGGGGWRR